jgi:hypothetical protein
VSGVVPEGAPRGGEAVDEVQVRLKVVAAGQADGGAQARRVLAVDAQLRAGMLVLLSSSPAPSPSSASPSRTTPSTFSHVFDFFNFLFLFGSSRLCWICTDFPCSHSNLISFKSCYFFF